MDIQKTMEFILEQTAATTANLQRMSESDARLRAIAEYHEQALRTHERDLHRHEEELRTHSQDLRTHTEDLRTHTEWLTGLSQAMQELSGQMKDGFALVDAKIKEVTEAHLATEESLGILIQTVQDILPRLPRQ